MKYTPRTDEKNDELLDQDSYTSWLEMSQFARQLERELNAAKERIKRLEDIIDRAANRFFADGPDGKIATEMLKILEEVRESKP